MGTAMGRLAKDCEFKREAVEEFVGSLPDVAARDLSSGEYH